jgi:putative ABC transport system permease protein
MAYAVAQRTREFGIRVALGATGARIARGVVGRGVALALIGSSAAIVIGAYGTKVIEKELFGVARSDVTSFALAVVVLVVVAIIACVVPARRALAVDPMTAIRAD